MMDKVFDDAIMRRCYAPRWKFWLARIFGKTHKTPAGFKMAYWRGTVYIYDEPTVWYAGYDYGYTPEGKYQGPGESHKNPPAG